MDGRTDDLECSIDELRSDARSIEDDVAEKCYGQGEIAKVGKP
jgi:hypothetical protein